MPNSLVKRLGIKMHTKDRDPTLNVMIMDLCILPSQLYQGTETDLIRKKLKETDHLSEEYEKEHFKSNQ